MLYKHGEGNSQKVSAGAITELENLITIITSYAIDHFLVAIIKTVP